MKYLVVHCSLSPPGRGDDAREVHRWHREKGYHGIGYHHVILEDGTVQDGRPHYWSGAHVLGHNSESLGILLIGNGPEDFTRVQLAACRVLLTQLLDKYPDAKICGHRDLDTRRTCPNFDVSDWWYWGTVD